MSLVALGQDWPQWGRNAQHQGAALVEGQQLSAILADVVYDPFAQLESAVSGDLTVHYAVSLIDGTGIYVETKSGVYIPCASGGPPTLCGSETWNLRAHFNSRYAYLVAVHPDLTPCWAASLRNILNDGCDVLLPPSGTPGGCRAGAARGVDPATNERPAGGVADISTSSPVVLPDGSVLYGASTSYNFLRGHLFKFSADGRPLATYDFGWDITPAVSTHDGTYSIVMKDNHYEVGSYCADPNLCPAEPGR